MAGAPVLYLPAAEARGVPFASGAGQGEHEMDGSWPSGCLFSVTAQECQSAESFENPPAIGALTIMFFLLTRDPHLPSPAGGMPTARLPASSRFQISP